MTDRKDKPKKSVVAMPDMVVSSRWQQLPPLTDEELERVQHERRVWEMLNSVVRACYSVDRITAVEVNHWAEEVVAEYERRMKEQKANMWEDRKEHKNAQQKEQKE